MGRAVQLHRGPWAIGGPFSLGLGRSNGPIYLIFIIVLLAGDWYRYRRYSRLDLNLAIFCCNCPQCGPWAVGRLLGRSWAVCLKLGPFLGRSWAVCLKLGPCWAVLGPFPKMNDPPTLNQNLAKLNLNLVHVGTGTKFSTTAVVLDEYRTLSIPGFSGQ